MMSKQAFNDFKRFWLENYKKQYKSATPKEKKELRDHIYKNINLSENEKDKIWESIVRQL